MVILLLFTQAMHALVSSNTNLGKKMPKTTQLLREKMTMQLLSYWSLVYRWKWRLFSNKNMRSIIHIILPIENVHGDISLVISSPVSLVTNSNKLLTWRLLEVFKYKYTHVQKGSYTVYIHECTRTDANMPRFCWAYSYSRILDSNTYCTWYWLSTLLILCFKYFNFKLSMI